MGVIKGDTRSLDNSSYGGSGFRVYALGFWVLGLGLRV